MEKKYYLGLDSSTQGTKLVLLSFAEKRPCYVDAVNYDKDLPEFDTHNGVIRNLGEGVSESDPRMWIQAIHILFGRLKNAGYPPKDIRVISVSGQQHGLVSLDTQGNLTRKRSKLWNDVSTYPECEEIITAVGGKEKVIEEVFNTMKPGYTAHPACASPLTTAASAAASVPVLVSAAAALAADAATAERCETLTTSASCPSRTGA